MKKLVLIVFAAFAVFTLSGCQNSEVERQKPSRDGGTSAKTPWGRPANWEGGLPGMGGANMPNQY